MNQIVLTIYLKTHRRPLAKMILSKEKHLEEFLDLLNTNNHVIRFYNVMFNKLEFDYATIIYK